MKKTKQILLFAKQLSPEEEILNCWNEAMRDVKGIPVHKSIQSKVQINNSFESAQLYTLIHKARLYYTYNEIKESIKNYAEIISSDKYYYEYKFKSLGFFLHSEKGVKQFISENNPLEKFQRNSWNPFTDIRNNLDFIVYNSKNKNSPLDTESNTYFGVPTAIFKTIDPERLYRKDLLPAFQAGDFPYGYLVWLEESIAYCLFHKTDLDLLKKLISLHRKISIKFKK